MLFYTAGSAVTTIAIAIITTIIANITATAVKEFANIAAICLHSLYLETTTTDIH